MNFKFFVIAVLLVGFGSRAIGDPSRFDAVDSEGFSIAVPGVPLEFPYDHGSHPQFKTEWWYLTGHLEGEEVDLGFQLTFFRSAGGDEEGQVYMAHAAVSDKLTQKHYHEERVNSEDWNAYAEVGRLDVFNGNWYLRMVDEESERMEGRFSLKGFGELQLRFLPVKERTLFGSEGYSQKGAVKGAASFYVTFTRLQVDAVLRTDDGDVPLSGLAWMDHEFSSSQLTEDQIGWNWTSAILDDGSELMAYVMRREDGQVDPHSRLTIIEEDGAKREFASDAFSWTPVRFWESPNSGGVYPVEYEIRWGERRLRFVPEFDAQEMLGEIGGIVYWEGAGTALDEDGNPVGRAYTELTGYSDSLYGKF